jgi:RimJ/RimL family protein N-acetyltransferase
MNEPTVRLRPVTEADLPDRVRWFNDPDVTDCLVHESEGTLEQEREWFATLSSRELPEVLAIEVDGRHIGDAALRSLGDGVTADFGILIGEKSCWGCGYGTAATREMLRIGFDERSLHRVQLSALATNMRAIRCYEKCGFRREGLQRQTVLKRGALLDLVIMGLLREEWDALQHPSSDGLCELGPNDVMEIIDVWEHVGPWRHTGEDVEAVRAALVRMQQSAVGWREAGELVGTAFGGWDGFRGWLYRVAVLPTQQRKGIASAMIAEVERRLIAGGARQINLMMRAGDERAHALYTRLGYEDSDADLMCKRFSPAAGGTAENGTRDRR